MAKLTSAARNKISGSNFALPGRRYPIEDKSEKAKVRAAVHHKYPSIGKTDGKYARKK